jgi:hypothetical protein
LSAMQYGNRALDVVGESEPGQSFSILLQLKLGADRKGSVPEARRCFRRCSTRSCPKCYSILASVFVGKITALIGTWNGGVETGADCEVAESEWAPNC